jgi:PAS domain S-box-containing protein
MKSKQSAAIHLPIEFHDVILDSIADGVFTVDKEWTITTFNKAAQKITGVAPSEAIGRKCWDVLHGCVCEQDCLLKKTLKTNRPCINKTIQIVIRGGKLIPVSISTAILKGRDGKVLGGVETFRDLSEVEELRKEIAGRHTLNEIITRDHRMIDLFETVPAIAHSDAPVLILGESGTGKELLAKALHHLSAWSKGPFIAVNCGALPENLIESELFGYRKGAFTDAKQDRPGRFERAKGGTLFLDEIGDLPKSVQAKLLRVLQERVYEPLGATAAVKADCRIIAATNRDLEAMVAAKEFRQDLYYRINVMPITLPPLRERTGDIPPLVEHFIAHYNTVYRKSIMNVSADAMTVLMAHQYPGNVRELENILQHAFVLCQGKTIEKKHLPQTLLRWQPATNASPATRSREDFEKNQIEQTLVRNKYARAAAAKELGVHPATLWRKMKRLGIASTHPREYN